MTAVKRSSFLQSAGGDSVSVSDADPIVIHVWPGLRSRRRITEDSLKLADRRRITGIRREQTRGGLCQLDRIDDRPLQDRLTKDRRKLRAAALALKTKDGTS